MFSFTYALRFLAFAAVAAGLMFLSGCSSDDDNPAGNDPHDHHHLEAVGTRLIHNTDTLCTVEGTVVTGSLSLSAGDTLQPIQVWFLDEDGDWLQPDSADADHALEIQIGDTAVVSILYGRDLPAPHTAWSIAAAGRSAGATTLRVVVLHEDHPDYTSPEIPVTTAAR